MTTPPNPQNPPPKRNQRRLIAVLAAAAAMAAACSIEPDTTITAANNPDQTSSLGDDAPTPQTTAPTGNGDPTGPITRTDDPQPGTDGPDDAQTSSEQPTDNPGTAEPDEQAALVAETGALIPGDDVPFTWLVTGRAVRDDNGNITYPGGEYGGFWWKPDSRWQAVLNETLDLCDDNDAYAAAAG